MYNNYLPTFFLNWANFIQKKSTLASKKVTQNGTKVTQSVRTAFNAESCSLEGSEHQI